jgi:predicted dehydrogenase/nucleoside-diphosphate-sugar epimerase
VPGVTPVRVGLVGAGYVSEFHVRALRRLPQVRIVGITDLREARARAVGEQFGLAVHPSLAAMAAAGLDVVHVLTPPESHTAVALEALAHGCHVLVEKPLATTVEDCDRLAAESAARGRHVCVSHSMLADPVFVKVLQAVRDGAVGDILTVDILRSSIFPPYHGGPLPPQYGAGGYPFRDLGVHALYMMRELLGPIEHVTAEFSSAGARSSDPNIHFDEWRALVRARKGSGHVQLSWNVRPLQHLIIVQGTRGTLRADLYTMFVTRRRNTPAPKAIERVLNAALESAGASAQVVVGAGRFAAGKIVPYQGLHDFVRQFYEALASGGRMPATVEDARDIVDWTERVARRADAAKLQARLQVPSTEPAIVVTGANGLLGRALVRRLLDDGERVRLFVRRPPAPDILQHPRVDVVLGELGDPAAVDQALRHATTVFHCGAAMAGPWPAHESATVTGTRNVVTACLAHGVPKLVHVSSLSVLHVTGLANVTVTESSPLEPSPDERGFYTRAKLEAERIVQDAVREQHLPAVILRPGHIWSEAGPLLSPSVGIRGGNRLVMIGDPSLRLPLVHVDDVVGAMLLAAKAPVSPGEVFHLVDDDPMTREELAKLYIAAREPGLRVTHVPLTMVTSAAAVVTGLTRRLGRPFGPSPYRLRSGVTPLRFDCAKARDELGWRPAVRSRTALRALLGAGPSGVGA